MKIEDLIELVVTGINVKWDVDKYGLAKVELSTFAPVHTEETRLKFSKILEEMKKDTHDWKLKVYIGVDTE